MQKTYTVWYRLPDQWFWRKVKNVIGDGIEVDGPIIFRFLSLEDDTIFHLPFDAAIKFDKQRAAVIVRQMSKEAGQPVQRA